MTGENPSSGISPRQPIARRGLRWRRISPTRSIVMSDNREISSEVPNYFFRPLFLVSGYFFSFIVGAFADCILAESRQDSYLILKLAPRYGLIGVAVALLCLIFENRLPRMLRDRRRPTLGGLLSIANVSLVFAAVVAIRFRLLVPSPDRYFETFVFSVLVLPIFWGLFVPQICDGYGFTDRAFAPVLLGLNAIAWGYLVAAIFKKVRSTWSTAPKPRMNADSVK